MLYLFPFPYDAQKCVSGVVFVSDVSTLFGSIYVSFLGGSN